MSQEIDYREWVIKNDLQYIWPLYCAPEEGVRLGATKPACEYSHDTKICSRTSCNGIAHLTDSPAAVYECDTCRSRSYPIYRWISASLQGTKFSFSSPDMILKRAKRTRSFYATLGVFDKDAIHAANAYDWNACNAYTLGIDIDIRKGFITDAANREALDKAVVYLKDVFSCCENSVNLQTSGNGLYFMLHHSLCTKDIQVSAGKFAMLLQECARDVSDITRKRLKIDAHLINASQVFKLAGSLHQTYPLVAIPIDVCTVFSFADLSQTNPDNFSMKNFVGEGGQVMWYGHKKISEAQDLYRMLDELNIDVIDHGAITHYERFNDDGSVEKTYNTRYQKDRGVNEYAYSVNNARYVRKDTNGDIIEPDDIELKFIERCERMGIFLEEEI